MRHKCKYRHFIKQSNWLGNGASEVEIEVQTKIVAGEIGPPKI